MWNLFKAEARRFRPWALAAIGLHLAVLGLLTRTLDLAQQPLLVYRVFGTVYGLAGLLLGLYQMAGYRRANTWLQLLHRPLPPWRIALALTAACALLLLAAVGLPIALTALGQDLFSARVVDSRHYLLAAAAALIAWCGYLAGAYTMLGGKRYAGLALVLPAWLAAATASGIAAFGVQLLILLWLAALVGIAFRPGLGATPRQPLALALTALPAMAGAFVLFRGLAIALDLIWILLGTHPLNSTPAPGGYLEAINGNGASRFEAGLAASKAEDAQLWRAQLRISQVHDLDSWFDRLPVRGELANPAPLEFDDEDRRVRWSFSHDTMRFHGVSLATRHAVGELGAGAEGAPFPLPALPLGSDLVATAQAVYQYDSAHQRLWPRLAVPATETLVAAAIKPIGDHVALLSDRALYFFDARELTQGDHQIEPRIRVATPGASDQLVRLDLIELLDGYLVSFFYGKDVLFGKDEAFQQILRVGTEGPAETVARRVLTADGPALWRYQHWWPSPVMRELVNGAEGLFAVAKPRQPAAARPRPRAVQGTAAALLLLSLGVAAWRVRRLPLPMPQRWAWVLACGAIGLPALISLWLLHPAKGSPVPA